MTIKNMMTITTINDDDNTEYLKTKVKSLGDKVTDFYDNEIPKVSNHSCLVELAWILFLKKTKVIIRKSFQKSVNVLRRMY